MAEKILVANVCPHQSVVGLKTVYIVERWKSAPEDCETWWGPYTVNGYSLGILSTCSGNTLLFVVADYSFIHSYITQGLCYLSVLNVVICVHSQYYIVSIISEISQKPDQVSSK